ncbi:MAG: PCYCGC motif-containing (lipo)protein [Chloroflexota bacterium]|nr:PCYCGC motif-containing (lipo)protein [Chloroflexota bacterium]
MTGYKRYLVGGGLLMLSLMLVGCQPVAGSTIEPTEPVAVEATPSIEAQEQARAVPLIEATEDSQQDPVRGVAEGFTGQGYPFQGDLTASVIIEEFSSYQCSFCNKYFLESYPQVVEGYVETGQVLYVFRDYPLPTQPQSQLAAEAANCAGQAGGANAYWAMHDRLFERQAEWSGKGHAAAIFKEYAAELGIDRAGFGECLDSGATRVQVEADATEGNARGVKGTPTFFINGQPLVGAQPYAAIAQVIDAALAGETLATAEPVAPAAGPTPAAIAPTDDALTLGNPDAPVTLVEFSDYQCPFCARHFQETWPRLKAEFVDTGRVRYVFKDFPIISIHPQAPKAHQAARCAGEQGEYWAMHDWILARQSEWSGNSDHVAVFKGYAVELGLETAAFAACLDGDRWGSEINADLAEGSDLGVSGTPAFFIAGYPLIGVQPYETFQYAIILAEQGRLGEAYQQQSSPPPKEDSTLKLAAVSELSPRIQQQPPEVQEVYRFALANPDVLDKIPCHCGCGNVEHMNNRMCYIQ